PAPIISYWISIPGSLSPQGRELDRAQWRALARRRIGSGRFEDEELHAGRLHPHRAGEPALRRCQERKDYPASRLRTFPGDAAGGESQDGRNVTGGEQASGCHTERPGAGTPRCKASRSVPLIHPPPSARSYAKSTATRSATLTKPARPVAPTDRSLPPSIITTARPAVPLSVPCRMAAAITDRALRVTYRNSGVRSTHHTVIMGTPRTECSG